MTCQLTADIILEHFAKWKEIPIQLPSIPSDAILSPAGLKFAIHAASMHRCYLVDYSRINHWDIGQDWFPCFLESMSGIRCYYVNMNPASINYDGYYVYELSSRSIKLHKIAN